MIDARPLLDCLDALESSARRDDADGAREAERRLEATWPPLRARLAAPPPTGPDLRKRRPGQVPETRRLLGAAEGDARRHDQRAAERDLQQARAQ